MEKIEIKFSFLISQIHPILDSLASNVGERPEIHGVVLGLLFMLNAPLSMWQKFAASTWFEPSKQVASFIHILIHSAKGIPTTTPVFQQMYVVILYEISIWSKISMFFAILVPRRPTSPGPWSNPLHSAFRSPSPISALLTWTKESASWCTRSACATPTKAGPSIWLIATTTPWPENLSV